MNKAPQTLIDLKQIKKNIQLAFSNWYIIVGVLVLSGAACYLYLANQEHTSTANVGISLINKGQKYINYSQDEAIAINSPELVEKAIESLRMDVSYFHKT